jgi:Ras-related protein Rab-18
MKRTVKALLIGDSGVGKSSLMMRFTCDKFDEDIGTTIGIDFKVKTVELDDGTTVTMQLWDTAGQERFRTLTASYYRGAQVVVLVYDVNSSASFLNVARWLDEVRSFCGESVILMLIGNKIDLFAGDSRCEDAVEFAKKNNMLFALCSAKTREGVSQAFDEVARRAMECACGEIVSGVKLGAPQAKHESRGCC